MMYPHEFDLLWRLREENLTAGELGEILSRPIHSFPRNGRWISNQLRSLVKRGYVVGDGGSPAIYSLTEHGREYVDA